jgi:hypothetical protein
MNKIKKKGILDGEFTGGKDRRIRVYSFIIYVCRTPNGCNLNLVELLLCCPQKLSLESIG